MTMTVLPLSTSLFNIAISQSNQVRLFNIADIVFGSVDRIKMIVLLYILIINLLTKLVQQSIGDLLQGLLVPNLIPLTDVFIDDGIQ